MANQLAKNRKYVSYVEDKSVLASLDRLAKKSGKTRTDVIHEAIELWLAIAEEKGYYHALSLIAESKEQTRPSILKEAMKDYFKKNKKKFESFGK